MKLQIDFDSSASYLVNEVRLMGVTFTHIDSNEEQFIPSFLDVCIPHNHPIKKIIIKNNLLLLLLFIATVAILTNTSLALSGWTWQNPLPQGNTLNAVQFVSATTAFAVGGAGTIMKTIDAGITWSINHYAGETFEYLTALSFADPDHGLVVGYGGIILS
ncbi:MAG TPA: YCF48-related protein, partial [Bacteroidota bacterium]|nr:YCF48-related protein [Bacteroidota bacterium]